MQQAGRAVICSLTLAALSTVGDFIWANFIEQHRVAYSLGHGALLLAAVGACLGWLSGRLWYGAIGGGVIGALLIPNREN